MYKGQRGATSETQTPTFSPSTVSPIRASYLILLSHASIRCLCSSDSPFSASKSASSAIVISFARREGDCGNIDVSVLRELAVSTKFSIVPRNGHC